MSGGVLVLDFGSQYTQLIARRVRELGVYSEIHPCNSAPSRVDISKFEAVILSGGPSGVNDPDAPSFDEGWLATEKPVLGICYGMQLLCQLGGGRVEAGKSREYGPATLEIVNSDGLFAKFEGGSSTDVWMSHGDHVEELPEGYELLAKSAGAPIAAFGNSTLQRYGIQFHPEVVHTPRGSDILASFLFDISKCSGDWSPENFIESSIHKIRGQVGEEGKVICGLSGGVDSSVAAVLIDKAIGDRLVCIFVDNGLLRKNEAELVAERLGSHGLGLHIEVIDARERFLSELEGVSEPEQKRKIIGKVFIDVFEEEAKRFGDAEWLVQGTLYTDVIESESVRGPSAVIKSHHNVGGLPERMNLKLLEPFRELFKDEVRTIGKDLGVPEEIIQRQPFPGPGLAVRMPGGVTREGLESLREADDILQSEVKQAGLYTQLWQSFAVLLPVQSVGVMGDSRTYENALAIRAVHSIDGMTADWAMLPEDLLRKVSNRIINEVKGINRVVLDISSKPPATIEWE